MSTQEHKYIYESPNNGKTIYRRKLGNSHNQRELLNNKPFSWPLMKDCITDDDRNAMINFLKTNSRLTNGPMVKKFEQEWSSWLGCKYSLFVSSGSTANTLLVASIKEKYNLQNGDKVIVPCMTWVTNISPVMQLGLQPIFCDVDPKTFSFKLDSLKKISQKHPDIKMIFVSHLFGIAADIDEYKKIFPKSIFIEDVCESHGATYKGKKCGTLSEGSTFSSYFGHHMTTIEGGFVCTDDVELYNLMKMKRSHGMAREATPEMYKQYKTENPKIHPMFMFMTDGYNLRSMEINAVLGSSQLKRLDLNNKIRRNNFLKFINIISQYPKYFKVNYQVEGNSSFCLPFICLSSDFKTKLETFLSNNNIETRPLCSGNLLRQPFLQRIPGIPTPSEFPSVEFLHKNGFFIGNNHMINDNDFKTLATLIKSFINKNK
jgi:CDP-6-deoxy-D-xylo-4-hexulose-3-dehydrase